MSAGFDPLGHEPAPGVFDSDEAMRAALALAKNCGYAVFPCSTNKTPTRPATDGGTGYKDASTDPETIEFLWRHWPGPLIGIATGGLSNIAVLDIDAPRHVEARVWWRKYCHHLPRTRAYRTRSGGLHLYMRHAQGVKCSQGQGEYRGVDVRGDGGYAISWYAAGYECLSEGDFHAPIEQWPAWLSKMFWPRPEPVPVRSRDSMVRPGGAGAAGVNGLIRTVREAPEGQRNGKLNWAGFKMREQIARGSISESMARRELVAAAMAAGLSAREAIATISSAMGAPP